MVSTAMLMMLGIVPGAALMLAALSPFEGLFEDRRVFSAFAMGIVGGAFMGMFHGMLDSWALENIVTSMVVFVVLFALVQVMMLVALLNRKGIRQKQDAMFSGIAVGAGAGSFVVVYVNLQVLLTPSPGIIDVVTVLLISSSYTLTFCAAGIFAGMFAYRQDREHIITGAGVFILHSLAIMPFRWLWLSPMVRGVSLVISTLVAVGLFFHAYKILNANLSSETERAMRRESRRRKAADDGE